MDESVGFLMLVPMLVLSLLLLDYSGNTGLASTQMTAAAQRGADAAAEILATEPDNQRATERVNHIVNAAAIGVCDTASPQYETNLDVIRQGNPGQGNPGQVAVVSVVCPFPGAPPDSQPDSAQPGSAQAANTRAYRTAKSVRSVAFSQPFNTPQP